MSEVSSAGRLGFRAPPVVGGVEGVAELARVRGTDALGSVDRDISVSKCVKSFVNGFERVPKSDE